VSSLLTHEVVKFEGQAHRLLKSTDRALKSGAVVLLVVKRRALGWVGLEARNSSTFLALPVDCPLTTFTEKLGSSAKQPSTMARAVLAPW